MSRKRCHRKVRPITLNPMLTAQIMGTKLTDDEVQHHLTPLRLALDQIRQGIASENDVAVMLGHVLVAQALEHQGVYTGLEPQINAALVILDALATQANVSGQWQSPVLHWEQLDALMAFAWVYQLQLSNFTAGELKAASATACARHLTRRGALEHWDMPTYLRTLTRTAPIKKNTPITSS